MEIVVLAVIVCLVWGVIFNLILPAAENVTHEVKKNREEEP